MIINYLDIKVKYVEQGKLKQAMKLSEWANNHIEKNRSVTNEI